MMMIARIKCSKISGYVDAKHDEVWQYIKENYKGWRGRKDLILLYLTKRFVPGETSLIVNTRDADTFFNFLNEHILPLECVSGVQMFNLMKPRFFEIPTGTCLDLKRFTVTINALPSRYNEIYDALSKIEPTKYSAVGYIAYTFQDHGYDLVVSLLAESLKAARKTTVERIDVLDGVLKTDIVRITRTRRLYSRKQEKKITDIPAVSEGIMGIEDF